MYDPTKTKTKTKTNSTNDIPEQAVSKIEKKRKGKIVPKTKIVIDPNREIFSGDDYWTAFIDEMKNIGDIIPTYKDDPDFNEKYPINNKSIGTQLIPLYKPWGHIYSNKIFCMIPTLWPDRKDKMDVCMYCMYLSSNSTFYLFCARINKQTNKQNEIINKQMIASTYGPGCDELVWVVDDESNPPESYANHKFFPLSLTRVQNSTNRNIWEKIHSMYAKAYNLSLYKKYDWFIKADDDSFIFTNIFLL